MLALRYSSVSLLIFCLVLLINLETYNCGRTSSRGRSRPSSSTWGRPAPSRPSPYGWSVPARPAPSPSRPAPAPHPAPSPSNYGWNVPSPSRPSSSPSRPAPDYSKPSPNYGWNAPSSSPSRPSSVPAKPNPNYGWNSGLSNKPSTNVASNPSNPWVIPGRETKVNTQGVQANPNAKPSAPNGGQVGWRPEVNKQVNTGAQKPVGGSVGGADQVNRKTVGQQANAYPQGPGRPYPTQGPNYNQGYRPGYQPGGYNPAYGYGHQPSYGHYSGGNTIINNNNYYGGHGGYGGYGGYGGGFFPTYSYSYRDTGSTTLGFFLGYSLARLTTPTYRYYGQHHDRPVYDHYTVHHYYHNSETITKQTEVQPNSIAVCVGDSKNVCPSNTYALCTASGSIMCVASAVSTQPCADIKQGNCVQSTIPCLNNTTPECNGKKPEETTTVSIPCIYTTEVFGNISVVNNTIVSPEALEAFKNLSMNETIPIPPIGVTPAPIDGNMTNPNITAFNMTTPSVDITSSNGTVSSEIPVTTVEPPTKVKRDTSNQQRFCVTIVAEPAAAKSVVTNEVFSDAKTIFEKFAVKALGADRL